MGVLGEIACYPNLDVKAKHDACPDHSHVDSAHEMSFIQILSLQICSLHDSL